MLLAATLACGAAVAQETAPCGDDPPAVQDVVTAIFAGGAGDCDLNSDGRVGAADVVGAVRRRLATPTPTPTASATVTATTTDSPAPSFTPTNGPGATPTQTPTPTLRDCPDAGATLQIEVDNRSATALIALRLSGERTVNTCVAGGLTQAYSLDVECAGMGSQTCLTLRGLAPGPWLHSIEVLMPPTRQVQHRTSLLVADVDPNILAYTAFATVFTVRNTRNDGNGSLRQMLQLATNAQKPALIQFDPDAFPAGVITAVALDFQLPPLETNDVTLDGIDAAGNAGNRAVDAQSLPMPVFVMTGARNHLVGLRLQNAGSGDRDVLGITGPAAEGNLIERTIVENAASADGIGVDLGAGSNFAGTENVIRDCEISGAIDKGIKVTTGAHVRVERSIIRDNQNGGIQSTLGGHVQAWLNRVEDNRGGSAQNGLAVNGVENGETATERSDMEAWANVSVRNGANGMSVRGSSFADVRDNYLAVNAASGLRIFDEGIVPASAVVSGTSAVCNGTDGAAVTDSSTADFGGGALGSPGDNAFTQNNLPQGNANLRNATGMMIHAANNQWENCGQGATCNHDEILRLDLNDQGRAVTQIEPAQAHRSGVAPVLLGVFPAKGEAESVVRIFGTSFNVIDGHFAEDRCADVSGRNRCVPLRGNCVRIGGVSAEILAVTPTMIVARWPFTCIEPVSLTVTTDQGPTGATSAPISVCTNGTGIAAPP